MQAREAGSDLFPEQFGGGDGELARFDKRMGGVDEWPELLSAIS